MVENEILIATPRDRVFAVRADAKRYADADPALKPRNALSLRRLEELGES